MAHFRARDPAAQPCSIKQINQILYHFPRPIQMGHTLTLLLSILDGVWANIVPSFGCHEGSVLQVYRFDRLVLIHILLWFADHDLAVMYLQVLYNTLACRVKLACAVWR